MVHNSERPRGTNLGIIGLGLMGHNIALNLCSQGIIPVVFDQDPEKTARLSQEVNGGLGSLCSASSAKNLIEQLDKPRIILLLLPAHIVTVEIKTLAHLLEAGDTVVDCGNSFFKETQQRSALLTGSGISFFGAGVSGGKEGARYGASIMLGGPSKYRLGVEAVLQRLAAKGPGGSCLSYMGEEGAGHFVKMVHNGIEYADMQLLAEASYLLKHQQGLSYPQMAEIFEGFNRGPLQGYLTQITADILSRTDGQSGKPLLDIIQDQAGQKGTGSWTVQTALELGVAVPTLSEAVFSRTQSGMVTERGLTQNRLPLSPDHRVDLTEKIQDNPLFKAAALQPGEHSLTTIQSRFVQDLEQALIFSRISVLCQGFDLLKRGGEQYGWPLDLAEISRIWQQGCIIRSQLLVLVEEAYRGDSQLHSLLFDPPLQGQQQKAAPSLRRVVCQGVMAELPIPALSSALSYWEVFGKKRLWTDLIQAQRDYFGSHSFSRIDREGKHHIDPPP
jgi:6-phosphogluconate dehydrogenase